MKQCIVSLGTGGWYERGVERLRASLEDVGWEGGVQIHVGVYPKGCPTHQEVPYAFKLFCIQKARSEGYDQVLWLDSSVWAIGHPGDVFKRIQEQGHYFWTSGCNCGNWCSDECLRYFGLTRERALDIEMLYALIIGLDFRNPRTQVFFDRWQKALDDGIFPGPWKNPDVVPGEPWGRLYQGHRHDQSAASLIAHELGMAIDPTHDLCRLPGGEMPETVRITAQGM